MNKSRTVLFRIVSLLICAVLIMGPVLPAQAAVLEPITPQAVTATLLSENFETGALPAGWQVIGTPGWRFDNPGNKSNETGGAGKFAIADSDYAGSVDMTTELRTPTLNLTGYTVVMLNFKFAFVYNGNEAGDIDVSLDGGTTWPYNIWHIDGNTPTAPLSVPLPPQAIGQSNVKLRFRYSNAFYAWYWQIDEVRVEATGGAQPPVAPGPISFGATTPTSLVVNWADNSANETGFKLERSMNGTSGWAQLTTTGANIASYADTSLTCNTTYFYRVRATNATGDSAYSTVNSNSTASCPPTVPAAPGNLAVTSASTTQIGLSWQDNSPNETGFKLERSPNGTTSWVQISTFAANTTTGADGTAACGSTYYYRLRATNATGDSAYTAVVSSTTTACPPAVPAAPSGLVVTPTSVSQINLSWTDNSNNESEFWILRSPDNGSNWTRVGTVPANVTSYAYTGLSCNTTFYYAITAYNPNGYSDFSNTIQATTLACPPPAPVAPGNLTAPTPRQTEVTLNWEDNSNNETGFKIERSPNGSTGWTPIYTVTAGVTTYLNTGLTCNTRYSYRVRATNANGDSAYSNAVDALTAACSPTLTSLNEQFNSPSLPAGWVISPTTGATAWTFVNTFTNSQGTAIVPGGGTYFAVANSSAAGQVAMNTELRTPLLNLSANTGVRLTFKTYFKADGTSTADVDVSINGGTTWNNIWRKVQSGYQGTVSLDVPEAVGKSNVRFRFHYYNANNAWYWLVDDVEVANALTSAAPSAPNNLSAQVSGSNVVVNWTDNSSTEANFIIERSADGSTGWVEAGRVGANTATFTHQNVACNTTVYYRVKATSGAQSSDYSNSANVTTPICTTGLNTINENFNGTSLPAGWTMVKYYTNAFWEFDQPSQLGTTGNAPIARNGQLSQLRTPVLNYQNTPAVLLQFSSKLKNFADQSPAQGVKVDVSRDGGTTWTTVWQKYTQFDGVGTISLDISAQAANQPSVMIRFMSELVYSDELWQIDDVAIGPLSAPTTPANLSTTLTEVSGVLLAWSGSAGSNFKLERSTNGVNWSQIADITDGASTYIDNEVASFTNYQYRVRAYNTAGQSSFSTVANVTTGDRSVRYVDVTISMYTGAPITTTAGQAKYEAIIRYFADGVYESSNGADRLRKITIYPDQQNWNTANIQWTPSCHPQASVGGYGKSGQQVYMCDAFNNQNYLIDDYKAQRGGYGSLTHEWGHYFYGLYDEYRSGPATSDDIGAPLGTDIASTYSAMCVADPAADTATQPGDLRWLNFSNNTQYFSLRTAQGRVYGASAWQVLARPKSEDPQNSSAELRPYWPELAAVAPLSGTMPQIDLPGGRDAARAQLQIVWMPAAGAAARVTYGPNATLAAANNVVREVVVDRSALMVDSGYLDQAKTALTAWFNQMPIGDTVGVIAFDSTASEVLPLTDVVDQSSRDVLVTSLSDIVAGDADTAPGAALQLALDTLTAPSVPTDTTRVVYFLTAGRHTTGTYPFAVVPGLQANNIALYTFGFDPLAGDKAELRQLAELTQGQYNNVLAASDLQKALSQSDQATSLTNDVTLAYDAVDVTAGTTVTVPVMADPSLANLDFWIDYYGEPVSATLSVIDPLGTPHPINTGTDCTTTGTGVDAETTCEVSYPGVAGNWAIRVHAVSDVYTVYYVSAVAADGQSTYDAVINGMGESTVAYPQPIVVEATTSRDFPIAGLTAIGWAYEPDGSWSSVDFHDDGLAPDRIADDGTYSAYVDYKQDGEHWVTVHFDNHAGTGYYTDRGLMTTGEQILPAITDDFERYAEYQVTVTGWQEDDHADWPDDPNWPATPLTLDNTQVPGRIDYANDVDVFAVTVPNDYTQTLGVRVNHLGLGMDPYVYVYAADYSWEFDRYIDYAPTSDDALFFPVDAAPGETFFIEVWHYSGEADTGTYNVSAGQYLSSDPIAQDKIMYQVYLPLMVR